MPHRISKRIDMFYIFVKQFLFFFLFVSFGYVIGRAVLRNFSFFNTVETYVFSITIGWGSIVLLTTLLGFLGWLQPFTLFSSLVIVFVVCLLMIIRDGYFESKHLFQLFKNKLSLSFFITLGFFVLLYFILLFYLSAYPITEWDAVGYHLPVVKEFISQGKIVPMPFLRFPVFPCLIEMFFTLALMLGDPLFANLTQYAMAIVLALLIYSFTRRYFNREMGLFSAFVFLSSPIVSRIAVVPYVEVGTTLFCFSAFYTMHIWLTEKNLSYGMLSAVFWGLAFASKYYAVLFFLIVFPSTIIIFGKEIKFSHLIPMVVTMLLIAFPWYFRNKIYSGDWFFPLYIERVSDRGVWSLDDIRSQVAQLRSLGLGRDIKSLFMLPINLLVHGDQFGEEIGLFIMISLGSLFFMKRWPRFITQFVIIVAIYGLIWFYNFQVARYLFPILPILSLLTTWTLKNVDFYAGFKSQRHWNYLIIIVLIFGSVDCIKVIRRKGIMPVTNTEKFEYLAKQVPTYKAIDFLNSIEGKDVIVYTLFDEGSVFYHKNKVIGDWFGPAGYGNVLPYIYKPVLLHKILKSYKARYLLVNKSRIDDIIYKFDESLFMLIYNDQNALVFEIL